MSSEAVREMTFIEEYEILQKESERVFASEKEGYEPPLANCVLRRALRCIDKLMKTSRREWYQKGYQDGLNADKWISVEERLPSEDEEVIISTKTERVYIGVYTTRYGGNKREGFICEDGFIWMNVTNAWQPLPQPYKKEGAENEM